LIGSDGQGAPLSEMSPAATGGADLMSVTEAAAKLRLSRMTVLRRLKSESWPGGRSGRKYLLNSAFVNALAAEYGSRPNVVAEDFAAEWMARSAAGAVA
jgi:excisionase family DNA binding protein